MSRRVQPRRCGHGNYVSNGGASVAKSPFTVWQLFGHLFGIAKKPFTAVHLFPDDFGTDVGGNPQHPEIIDEIRAFLDYGITIAVNRYVNKLLRGARPNDLPVQYPTKFDVVVNMKTAKALGLTIPEPFLSLADEVIE